MDDRQNEREYDMRNTCHTSRITHHVLQFTTSSQRLFWLYLLLITAAELLTSLLSPMVGLVSHIVLMVVLLGHAALGRTDEERKLALALVLAPMIRLLSLSLPLITFPQQAWYPMTSIPLLVATWIIIRQQNIPRQALGLRIGNLPLQLLIGGAGLGLGAIEYAILAPEPLIPSFSWGAILIAGLSLAIFTGFNEELIFRGLLQSVSLPVLRSWGLLYISLLFGALHIGYLSVLDVVFVTVVGLIFAYIVRWSGSILGVTLAHGATNITLFLIMPYLVREAAEVIGLAFVVAAVGMLAAMIATYIFWRQSRKAAIISRASGVPARQQATEMPLQSSAIPDSMVVVRSKAEATPEPSAWLGVAILVSAVGVIAYWTSGRGWSNADG